MIKIKMHDDDWRIVIGDEVWEFECMNDFIEVLETLITIKDKFGRL